MWRGRCARGGSFGDRERATVFRAPEWVRCGGRVGGSEGAATLERENKGNKRYYRVGTLGGYEGLFHLTLDRVGFCTCSYLEHQ